MKTIEIYNDRFGNEIHLSAHLGDTKVDISQIPYATEVYSGGDKLECNECEETPEGIIATISKMMLTDAEYNAESYEQLVEDVRGNTWEDCPDYMRYLYGGTPEGFEDAIKQTCKSYAETVEGYRERAARLRAFPGLSVNQK